jgi:hypothetical protein
MRKGGLGGGVYGCVFSTENGGIWLRVFYRKHVWCIDVFECVMCLSWCVNALVCVSVCAYVCVRACVCVGGCVRACVRALGRQGQRCLPGREGGGGVTLWEGGGVDPSDSVGGVGTANVQLVRI